MKNFITKQNIWYRIQQLIILVLHFALLRWMYFTLSNSGSLSINEVFYHFIGMSIMGAVLIRGCAYWANYHYQKELKERSSQSSDESEENL